MLLTLPVVTNQAGIPEYPRCCGGFHGASVLLPTVMNSRTVATISMTPETDQHAAHDRQGDTGSQITLPQNEGVDAGEKQDRDRDDDQHHAGQQQCRSKVVPELKTRVGRTDCYARTTFWTRAWLPFSVSPVRRPNS
jgi:hypothetical protein